MLARRKPLSHPEDAVQQGIVAYLRAVLPPKHYRVCAIPNGGKRSKIEAAIMKATGTLAGMPDLMIIGPLGQCWFVECKSEKGTLSPAQRDMRDWMILIGVPYVVARSLDDVKAALKHWRLDTREATP